MAVVEPAAQDHLAHDGKIHELESIVSVVVDIASDPDAVRGAVSRSIRKAENFFLKHGDLLDLGPVSVGVSGQTTAPRIQRNPRATSVASWGVPRRSRVARGVAMSVVPIAMNTSMQ